MDAETRETSQVRADFRTRKASFQDHVEIVAHYSNTPDLLIDLRRTCQALAESTVQDEEPGLPPHPPDRMWRVCDKLSDHEVQTIVNEFKAGVPKHQLAERYSVSVSSIKRLLRQHDVKRVSRYDKLP